MTEDQALRIFLDDAKRTGDIEPQNALEAYERVLLEKLRQADARPGADPSARFEALTTEGAVRDFVRGYEEPALARQFGDEYEQYRHAVRAWLPRRRPWRR